MTRTLRTLMLGAIVLAVSFALIACEAIEMPDEDAPAKDALTFAIGFGGPLTQGDVAFGQGARRAVVLAIEQANASPRAKEAGIQFRVADGDDQSRADRGIAVANTLVSLDDLVGVVGHFNSTVSIPVSQVYAEAGIVQISYASTSPDLTAQGLDNVFRTCATDLLQGPVAAQSAIDLGKNRVFVVDDSSIYGYGLTNEFSRAFTDLEGTILGTASTEQGQSDFSDVIAQIAELDPDFVYFGGTYSAETGNGATFSRQLAEEGVSAPLMGGDGIQNDAFISEAGPLSEGDMATKPGTTLADLPKGEEFTQAYAEMFPGQTPGGFDAFAFDATNAIINAVFKVVEEHGGADDITSREGRRAIIDAVQIIQFEGVTGPVSFDEFGDSNNPTITTYLVSNGKWIPHPDLNHGASE